MTESTENVSAKQLEQFITRIETLEEDKKSVADDIKDVYAEAGGTGFDKKILRLVIKRRAMDRAAKQEMDALVETYENALTGGGD